MTWILDDAPFHSLACEVDAEDLKLWPTGELFVADATAAAAAEDRSGRRVTALGAISEISDEPVICRFAVSVASPAGRILYSHLRVGVAGTANLAEHQSIAWALAENQEAVLVTRDKHAALLALAELGRCRVCHAYELWFHLRQQGRLSDDQYKALLERTRKADASLPGVPWRMQ